MYSEQYLRWANEAALAIRQAKLQWSGHNLYPISVPINLRCLFYFKDRQAEPDLSALYEGIQDVLEKEGIIKNDKLIFGHDGSTKLFGGAPRIEVQISKREKA